MSAVVVGRTEFDGRRAATRVSVDGTNFDISLTARESRRAPELWGDVWAPLALFPAMATGLPLELTDPMSPELFRGIVTAQEILTTWYPEFTKVPIVARTRRERRAGRRVTRQLFTGGVDSFHTLLTHPEVSELVYAHDSVHEGPAVDQRVTELLDSVVAETGHRMIHVDSDVRTMVDQFGEWGQQTHGAVLAAVGAFVSTEPTTFLIPGTHTYRELRPLGSHPLLDPLWGSGSRTVIYDGADRTRYQKVMGVAQKQVALDHLRVCWLTQDKINCSQCDKCIRTMMTLEIAGKLSSTRTFEPLSAEKVRSARLGGQNDLIYAKENLVGAQLAGRGDLAELLQEQITEFEARPR